MPDMLQCYSVIIDRGLSAPGHGKEAVYGINAVDNSYIYQLMYNFQLHGSHRFDSQMQMHNGNQNNDVSLAKEFQQHLTKEHRKNGVFDQGKYTKRFMEIKWTDRKYLVQDNADVTHKDVKINSNTNKFPALLFCGPHSKPHDARGVIKHCYFIFESELGNGVCAIHRISYACVACKSMLEKFGHMVYH